MQIAGTHSPLVMFSPWANRPQAKANPQLTPQVELGHAELGETFATALVNRLQPPDSVAADEHAKVPALTVQESLLEEDALSQQGWQDGQGAADRLASSLGNAIDWLRQEFGDVTAQSAMALMARPFENPEGMTEAQFSQGLLQTVRLVDGQFGFAAGDRVINQINGELNSAINAYFSNGLNERFLATPPRGALQGAVPGSASATAATAMHANIASMLDDLQASMETLRNPPEQSAASSREGRAPAAAPLASPATISVGDPGAIRQMDSLHSTGVSGSQSAMDAKGLASYAMQAPPPAAAGSGMLALSV